MTPVLQAMNEWSVTHVEHLNKLYGGNRQVESFEVNDVLR